MAGPDRSSSLCPRCGAIQAAPSTSPDGTFEGSCPECGLGFSGGTLKAKPRTSSQSGQLRRRRPDRALREFEQNLTSALSAPPFPLFGLDESWTGSRWPAGAGSGTVLSVQLGHGDPHDHEGRQVQVGTKAPADLSSEFRSTAQQLVHSLWNDGVEHTNSVRAPFTADDPTEGWDDLGVVVDGSSAQFKLLGSERTWVALAGIDGLIVTIHSENVAPDEVRLSRLDDLTPYLDADAFPWRNGPDR